MLRGRPWGAKRQSHQPGPITSRTVPDPLRLKHTPTAAARRTVGAPHFTGHRDTLSLPEHAVPTQLQSPLSGSPHSAAVHPRPAHPRPALSSPRPGPPLPKPGFRPHVASRFRPQWSGSVSSGSRLHEAGATHEGVHYPQDPHRGQGRPRASRRVRAQQPAPLRAPSLPAPLAMLGVVSGEGLRSPGTSPRSPAPRTQGDSASPRATFGAPGTAPRRAGGDLQVPQLFLVGRMGRSQGPDRAGILLSGLDQTFQPLSGRGSLGVLGKPEVFHGLAFSRRVAVTLEPALPWRLQWG